MHEKRENMKNGKDTANLISETEKSPHINRQRLSCSDFLSLFTFPEPFHHALFLSLPIGRQGNSQS